MKPLAYFLTFTTYGTWLHGDARQSIVKENGKTKLQNKCQRFETKQRENLKFPKVILNRNHRKIVLSSLIKVCEYKEWDLFALHVRSNHVHLVMYSDEKPERILATLKAWATRSLREEGFNFPRVWTKHGSAKLIFQYEKLCEKVHYVLFEQGKTMECYCGERSMER